MWEGCNLYAWLRLLLKNRFAVNWRYWYIAAIVTFVSTLHTIMAALQWVFYGRAIARTKITHPPIFILGHWRTGTTLLHELMIQDPRHGYPTTYECLDPNHFLLTERFFTRWMPFLMPKQRPMDNMKAGFDRPQEDEFALCMLGTPSPYLTIAFPNHPPQDQEYLDLKGLPERQVRAWQRSLMGFLRRITYKTGKRLVLKSPTHTARIKVLKEMFPDALFVHIVRDPRVVFPSTMNLWRTLYRTHGLQKPTFAGLEEHVLSTFTRMYQSFDEGKNAVDSARLYELRYEDLVKNPIDEIRKIYEHLRLDGFEAMRPHLEAYLAGVKGYETNKYQLAPEQRQIVETRWGEYLRRYGYDSAEPVEKTMTAASSPG
jgi:hypothetical protein